MPGRQPLFKSAFNSPGDQYDKNLGVKPVIFDIISPDLETSILPDYMKLVLHVNPSSFSVNYEKTIERIPTNGGFVEQHWGEGIESISFNAATGGFMRLYSGLSNITGGPGAYDVGGSRRETIAYDKYLDLLALFHNNGSVYDLNGKIVFQGFIKITFDEGIYLGFFNDFKVDESADKPYQFTMSASFNVQKEILNLRSGIDYINNSSIFENLPDLLDPSYDSNRIG